MKLKDIRIGTRTIGAGHPVFIIAEISGNHNQDIERAKRIIDAAADAGADAIKMQTYTADTITLKSDRPEFLVTWQGKQRTLHDLYQEAYTPWEWHAELFAHAKSRGLIAFSTPFDTTAVAFLEKLKQPVFKVSSFEVVDIPLLEAIGKTKKPVIMSRGMASVEEINLALKTLRKFGTKDIVVLQCVSEYPAEPKQMNLKTIPDITKRFKTLAGLSDHSLSNDVAVAAVALGAVVIEKHLTLQRRDGGPDSGFSMEPVEFAALVSSIRTVEAALGEPTYTSKRSSEKTDYRKSLFAAADIKKGERFTSTNIRSVRPGYGLPPKMYRSVLGKHATTDIAFSTPLSKKQIGK